MSLRLESNAEQDMEQDDLTLIVVLIFGARA
jgi:hypothetical protein